MFRLHFGMLIFESQFLQMNIKSICLTLEAGVGHRTIPMLLAKSSFHGDVKNWSTLINLHSKLDLEVKQLNNQRIYTTTRTVMIIMSQTIYLH